MSKPPPLPPGLDIPPPPGMIPPSLQHKLSNQTLLNSADLLDALESPPGLPAPLRKGSSEPGDSAVNAPPGLGGPGTASDNGGGEPHSERYEDLKKFMQWKNPAFPEEHIELILKMFSTQDLADALRDKYGIVPKGWRELLESDVIKRQLPKGLSRSGSLKPGELEPMNLKPEPLSMSDLKINEILDSEWRFVNQISELTEKYLDRLYQIWDGSKANKDASKALGLTQDEANQIFEPLGSIMRFSQNLLSRLEIISLVRKQPITGEGRAIHVGRAFIAMAPKLHVYAPAVASYQTSLTILNDAVNRLPKKAGQYLNFIEWWEKVTAGNDVLRGQQLQAVLITPMQRIPRYKMLLEQLLKDCDHPESVPVIKEALDLFSSAAANINEAQRKHEKLAAVFGADLKPVSSTGSVKDGEVKITNTYQAKVRCCSSVAD